MNEQLQGIKCHLRKSAKVILIFALVVFVFSGMASAETKSKRVYVIDGSLDKVSYTTDEETVSALFKKVNISLNDGDILNVELDDELVDGLGIVIDRRVKVNIVIDGGVPYEYTTYEDTVGLVINEIKKENNSDYVLAKGSSSSRVEEGMYIRLTSIEEEVTTKTEAVPFETKVVENASLEEGTQKVVTEGVCGERTIITKNIYKGGELTSTQIVSDSVTKQPVTKVVEKGTLKLIKTNSGEKIKGKELSMRATAYTGGGITASGRKAQVGVVAVDKNVIPMGSRLYIEGYGYAVAGDTGGAIKGNKIDLYFNTLNEALNYGVKNVKVYVLD